MGNDYFEHRRLQRDIEELSEAAAAANSRTTRLRSELSALRGSIEDRIDAIGKAFDAYVELGDLREQLDAFPDSTQARLQAARAVLALAEGRDSPRLDHGDGAYWLTHATNALLSRAAGQADPAAESRALELGGAEFELFWVVAVGVAGMGPDATDHLSAALVADGEFSEAQRAIFGHLAAGGYGSQIPVDALAATLAAEPHEEWDRWIGGLGDTDADRLTALASLADATHASPEPEASRTTGFNRARTPAESLDTDEVPALLQGALGELISNGFGEEAPILARIRELRQIVEDPKSSPEARQPKRYPVGQLIRAAITAPTTDPQVRRQLLQAAAGPIGAWMETVAAAPDPEPSTLRMNRGGLISVTASGADQNQLARARQVLADSSPRRRWWAWVIAGLLIVLAVVCFVAGATLGGVFLLLAGIGAAVFVFVSERQRLAEVADLQQTIDGLGGQVDKYQAEARALDDRNRDDRRRSQELIGNLRGLFAEREAARPARPAAEVAT